MRDNERDARSTLAQTHRTRRQIGCGAFPVKGQSVMGYTYTQPPHWKRTRTRILREHQHRCHICGKQGADEVDHIKPVAEGGTHDDANLAPIHAEPCHRNKSERERQRGAARRSTRRPARRNPNIID